MWVLLAIFGLSLSGCGGGPPAPSLQNESEPVTKTVPNAALELNTPTGQTTEASPPAARGTVKDNLPLAARVNGRPIFLYRFEKQVAHMEELLQVRDGPLAGGDGSEQLAQIKHQVLEGLIEQEIIEQQADRLGVTISQSFLEARIQESRQGLDQTQWEEWLAANHLTYQTFRKRLRYQLVANQLFRQITQDIPPTADQVQISHIRVLDEATAWTIVDQLKKGGDFERIVQEQSSTASTPLKIDDPAWFPRQLSPLPPPVNQVAFSLQPGEIRGPLQTAAGFYIIKVENREAERPLTTEMFQTLQKKFFTNWLQEQRSAAAIETFVSF